LIFFLKHNERVSEWVSEIKAQKERKKKFEKFETFLLSFAVYLLLNLMLLSSCIGDEFEWLVYCKNIQLQNIDNIVVSFFHQSLWAHNARVCSFWFLLFRRFLRNYLAGNFFYFIVFVIKNVQSQFVYLK
jgi:hypothetical protein